jgi:hypothetical protein
MSLHESSSEKQRNSGLSSLALAQTRASPFGGLAALGLEHIHCVRLDALMCAARL